MPTPSWLLTRGNAACRHVRSAFPGIQISAALGTGDMYARVTYLDGPAYLNVERFLRDQYNARHLSRAHLTLRRQFTLPVVVEVLLQAHFPPRSLNALHATLHTQDAPVPTDAARLLARTFTGGEDLPTDRLSDQYRTLRRFLTPELVTAVTAATAPVDNGLTRDF